MTLQVLCPSVVDGSQWVQPVDDRGFDVLYNLEGVSLAPTWKPVPIRLLVADDAGAERKYADLPWLGGHALVFREYVLHQFGRYFESAGEFLPLDCINCDETFWLFNVCTIVDALDVNRSELTHFPSTGRVLSIDRHVFRPLAVRGLAAFRVPQLRTLFLTGDTAEALTSAELTGVDFEQVWREEP